MSDEEWQPPEDEKVRIVCAAVSLGDAMLIGPRHYDATMITQLKALAIDHTTKPEIQGFIDQFGRFWSRFEAMQIVKKNGQAFNKERNGHQDHILYSEGLY